MNNLSRVLLKVSDLAIISSYCCWFRSQFSSRYTLYNGRFEVNKFLVSAWLSPCWLAGQELGWSGGPRHTSDTAGGWSCAPLARPRAAGGCRSCGPAGGGRRCSGTASVAPPRSCSSSAAGSAWGCPRWGSAASCSPRPRTRPRSRSRGWARRRPACCCRPGPRTRCAGGRSRSDSPRPLHSTWRQQQLDNTIFNQIIWLVDGFHCKMCCSLGCPGLWTVKSALFIIKSASFCCWDGTAL